MTSTKYTVELTEEEAVALAMISMSNHSGHPQLTGPIVAVSRALNEADAVLSSKQYDLWKKIGYPKFVFGGSNG